MAAIVTLFPGLSRLHREMIGFVPFFTSVPIIAIGVASHNDILSQFGFAMFVWGIVYSWAFL